MAENEKEQGFMGIIKDGLSYVSQIVSASIFPPIVDGAESVMKKVEERMLIMEKKILRKICSFAVIGLGVLFLIIALLFFLTEYLQWSNTIAFLSIGLIAFIIGLILKVGESNI